MKTVKATENRAGERLDVFLAENGNLGLTRSGIQRLIAEGKVRCRGEVLAKNYRVEDGDEFTITLPEEDSEEVLPQNIPLDIIYEDQDLMAVNKSKGMVVHPAPGHSRDTLVNALLYRLGDDLSTLGGDDRPGIVHRLDRDTSGIMLIAKNDFTHDGIKSQLESRSISRIYHAVVKGRLPEDNGVINAPIGRHRTDRKRQAVRDTNSRKAVTRYRVIEYYSGFTYTECALETGRTHQIRVHMAHIGHPVLGDETYGGRDKRYKTDGQCLHSKELEFTHPRSGERIKLTADLPEYFQKIIDEMRC